MFSSEDKLKARSGSNKVGRFQFLKLLTEEYKTTQSLEAKQQVMANLANFAYDPINYGHIRTLGIIDLFLEQLAEDDPNLVRFALGGLCNLALDTENKEHINNIGGIAQISCCLWSSCVSTVIYAITTLMFLITSKHKTEITNNNNIAKMLELSSHDDKRVQNLAVIFLEDYCCRDQVHRVRTSVCNIPLPPSEPAQHMDTVNDSAAVLLEQPSTSKQTVTPLNLQQTFSLQIQPSTTQETSSTIEESRQNQG